MKSSSPAKKRKDIWLIVLSALDVITGVLSLIFTAIAIQVIAVMASGLTLVKAVKVAIQSEKTAIFVKPVAIYAVRKLTRSEKMKNFFVKIKENLKNNPITLVATIVELVICGGLGFALIDFVDGFAWATGWKVYALAFGAAGIAYTILLALTTYLGHDNHAFAIIRKVVKKIGGDKAVEVLEKANEEVAAAIKAEEDRKAAEMAAEAAKAEAEAKREAAEAAKAEEEQRIYEFALQREAEKQARAEAARRAQLVNAYSEEFRRNKEAEESSAVTEVVNNANSHNI